MIGCGRGAKNKLTVNYLYLAEKNGAIVNGDVRALASTMKRAGAQLHPSRGRLPFNEKRMKENIQALLFDLGRVVLDIDTGRAHARWAELAGKPPGHFNGSHIAQITAGDAFRRHERGEISDAAFFAALRSALQVDLTDSQLAEGWNAILIGEMVGIRAELTRAQVRLPLYAFDTNRVDQRTSSLEFVDLLSPFRKIYVSHEIGARKPDAAAFETVVADMGLPPQRILFFDDSAENVAGARACGLQAVQVATAVDVERALAAVL